MENQDYRLLVVDDNDDNLNMLSRRLEKRGFQVLTADGGAAALNILEKETVDLVLLDIMMPGIDGLEVLRRTRQRFSTLELPIIMATAKAGSEDIVQTAELGANDHVVKPLNFKVVLAKVQALLRSKAQMPKAAAASDSSRIEPGGILAGRYRLEELIGSGTFGVVYRAHHLDLAHDVAVKVLQSSVTANEETQRRFRLEGVAACRVQHPNAVRVTDFGVTDDGVAFLVMELLQGSPLVDELKQWTHLSPRRCLEILRPICEVLSQAHRNGLVHRDIKPENIFLHQTERGEVVKLLDFGIAKLVGENTVSQNLTAEGWVLGTPAYMAPERLANEGYDGRADVYSLGVMLFEMLAGRRPFMPVNNDPMSMIMQHVKEPPPTLRSVFQGAPEILESLIASCLAKLPEDRPDVDRLLGEFTALVPQIDDSTTEAPTIRPVAFSDSATDIVSPFASTMNLSATESLPSVQSVDAEAPTLAVDSDTVDTTIAPPSPIARTVATPSETVARQHDARQSHEMQTPSEAATGDEKKTAAEDTSSGSVLSRWMKRLRGSG